jgi:hypothetical protein
MGFPASEVGYTSAPTGRGDHEVHKGHVVALDKKIVVIVKNLWVIWLHVGPKASSGNRRQVFLTHSRIKWGFWSQKELPFPKFSCIILQSCIFIPIFLPSKFKVWTLNLSFLDRKIHITILFFWLLLVSNS